MGSPKDRRQDITILLMKQNTALHVHCGGDQRFLVGVKDEKEFVSNIFLTSI